MPGFGRITMKKAWKGYGAAKGASVVEYAVLLFFMGGAIVLSALSFGFDVRSVFERSDAALTAQLASQDQEEAPAVVVPPEEPPVQEPLVMTFSGPATFAMIVYSSAEQEEPARIDWGPAGGACDSTVNQGSGVYDCTFSESGMQTVRVYADVDRLNGFDGNLVSIDDWGTARLRSLHSAFMRATGLQALPTDLPETVNDLGLAFSRPQSSAYLLLPVVWTGPSIVVPEQVAQWNISNVVSLYLTFQGASNIPDLSGWNTGKVQSMTGTFSHTTFNGDISQWNVATTRTFTSMFANNPVFNQDIGGWDVSRATSLSGMFQNATAFNQDLGGWDTSDVQYFGAMFAGASAFNQDLSSWNTSKAFHVTNMFANATAFAQDVSMWDSRRFEQMSAMFRNTPLLKGDYSGWRPRPQVRGNSNTVFLDSTGRGDLRCWDMAHIPNRPGGFADNSAISFEPLWGQPVPESCTTQGVPPSQVP